MGSAPGTSAEPEPPGEWLTIDGVAYRCVVLCFLFRPGPGSAGPRGASEGNPAGDDPLDGIVPRAGSRHHGNGRHVLLGLKRTGFGAGRIVALGGKIDGRESVLDAVVREVAEESGLEVPRDALRDAGRISWSFPDQPGWNMVAFLFTGDAGPDDPTASEEIEPRWYSVEAIPWNAMWKDAPYWLPALLDGERVDAHIVMEQDNEGVASAVLR